MVKAKNRLVFELLEGRQLLSADLSLSITSAPDVSGQGDHVSYQVEVANEGSQSVAAAVLHNQVGLQNAVWNRRLDIDTFTTGDLDGTIGFEFVGSQNQETVGRSAHAAGDINGDGFDDFIVGADGLLRPSADFDFTGGAYVVFGSANAPTQSRGEEPGVLESATLDGTTGFQLRGFQTTDLPNVGLHVSGGHDINGDGLDDVIIGAPLADHGDGPTGAAYVLFGAEQFPTVINLDELDGTNGFTILGEFAGDRAGDSVAITDDINGDGIGDIVVGSPEYSSQTVSGAAYVVFGASSFAPFVRLSDLNGTDGFVLFAEHRNQFGHHIAGLGDVNGDEISDVLITSLSSLVFGSDGGFDSEFVPEFNGSDGVVFNDGPYVAAAGDFNGDGYNDMFVDNHLVFGKATWSGEFDLDLLDGSNGFEILRDRRGFDISVSGIGDVNGDGLDDVIAARPSDSWSDPTFLMAQDQGIAYVIFGSTNDTSPAVDPVEASDADGFLIRGEIDNDNIGRVVSRVGDVNGDGIADLLITADGATPSFSVPCGLSTCAEFAHNAGEAYVVYGRKTIESDEVGRQDAIILAPGDAVLYTIEGLVLDDVSQVSVQASVTLRDVLDDDPNNNSDQSTTAVSDLLSGDIDLDGRVSFRDFVILSAHFGKESGAVRSEGDLNGDSAVDFADFTILRNNFGRTRQA